MCDISKRQYGNSRIKSCQIDKAVEEGTFSSFSLTRSTLMASIICLTAASKARGFSQLLKSPTFLNQAQILYKIGGKDMDFPFWFGLNGPLTDAIHHVGQITSLWRASANPIDQGINAFIGKKMPQ